MLNRRNLVMLEGNLTRDPEIHTVGNGGAQVVHFTLALNGAGSSSKEKSKAGFFDCKFWLTDNDYAAVADVATARAGFGGEWKKGERLHVFGRLSHETWEKDGQQLGKVVLVCDRVEAVMFRPAGDNAQSSTHSAQTTTTQAQPVGQAIPSSF